MANLLLLFLHVLCTPEVCSCFKLLWYAKKKKVYCHSRSSYFQLNKYSNLIESILLFFFSFAQLSALLNPVCTTGIIIIILTPLRVCAISIVSPQCKAVLPVAVSIIHYFNVWNINLRPCWTVIITQPKIPLLNIHMLSWPHPSVTWSSFFGWKWSRGHKTFDDPCSNAKVVTNPFNRMERYSGFSYDLGFDCVWKETWTWLFTGAWIGQ